MQRRHDPRHVDRREFLRYGAAGCACAFGALPQEPRPQPRPAPAPAPPFLEFEEATIAALEQKMQSGALGAKALTEAYLARIDALDRRGPTLRSVIETNPDALSIAEAMDAERKSKGPRGPLHGIPVLVKDNLDTADRRPPQPAPSPSRARSPRGTPSWWSGCARPEPWFSAKPT